MALLSRTILIICTAAVLPLPAVHARGDIVDFDTNVKPIFAAACYGCHGQEKQKGGLRLDVGDAALKGGDDGIVIVPHHASDSVLIKYVSGSDPDKRMPPRGDPLSQQQVTMLQKWIDQGAKWPAAISPANRTDPKLDHWSFKPITKPSIPPIATENPIDAFVLAKLHEKGMAPAPPADKRTLIRRVTFDLTGLPPTPKEVADFLADQSPSAYEKVVDRLLSSPRYGERWARHWMDLIHYADSHGDEHDLERPNAWPYRDYLIRSFNQGKAFGQFIEEQVAGDVLYPNDPQATVALGFIAAGPWDDSTLATVMDNTVDKLAGQNLDRDDMVDTVMTTFTSTTVHCARCHNHKFDPISQEEYYGLQADFAGVDRADRPFDSDPKIFVRRAQLTRQKKGLESGHYDPAASPDSDDTRVAVRKWENQWKAEEGKWDVIEPKNLSSTNGVKLELQPDGSVSASGIRPDKDVYVVTGTTHLTRIAGVKLELLTDESLPHGGPGLQENGNVRLTDFGLTIGSARSAAAFGSALADFNEDKSPIGAVLDHKLGTGWGIYPQVGQRHVAAFALKQPIEVALGQVLCFTLKQELGRVHLIGRFRLSVTDSTQAAATLPRKVPDAIASILEKPPGQRNDMESRALALFYLNDRIDSELKALPAPQMVYAATHDFTPKQNFKPSPTPRPVFVLRRGDVLQPIAPAAPGALTCVPGLNAHFAIADKNDEQARRAALAKWLSDPRNCLTWRSIVNRAWQYRFGNGLVSTPNDFGHMGALPSNPQLLDWLATWFLDHSQSLRQLDRLLVTSQTYQQSTQYNQRYADIDGDNRLLWRMNRNRLDAESVHDAILAIAGQLDTTMGGPGSKMFIEKPGVQGPSGTPVLDYDAFDVDSAMAKRLSIYRFIWRTVPDPFMNALDYPDGSQLTAQRNVSITALQALAMMNDRFVLCYSRHFADRLAKQSPDVPQQIASAYELCFSRGPTNEETQMLEPYISKHGLASACRLLFNSSEFMFVN